MNARPTMHPSSPSRTSRPRRGRQAAGFTLVEMATTVCVAMLGLAIGLPSFAALARRERDTAVANQLASYMASARSTAVTYRKRVLVCPYDGLGGCRQDGEWTGGWVMFYDADGNREPDDPTDIMRLERPPADPQLRVLSSSGRPLVGFTPSGATTGSNLTVRICRGNILRRTVVVNMAGRARVEPTAPLPCME